MYKIEKTQWGFKLTFSGFIQADEMKSWVEESQKELSHHHGKFGVMVDMRSLNPLPNEAQKYMNEGQKLYQSKGMERSAVVLNNPVTTMQFRRIARETGIQAHERYVDASHVPDWEEKCVDWVTKGKDPESK